MQLQIISNFDGIYQLCHWNSSYGFYQKICLRMNFKTTAYSHPDKKFQLQAQSHDHRARQCHFKTSDLQLHLQMDKKLNNFVKRAPISFKISGQTSWSMGFLLNIESGANSRINFLTHFCYELHYACQIRCACSEKPTGVHVQQGSIQKSGRTICLFCWLIKPVE